MKKKLIAFFSVLTLLLAGCGSGGDTITIGAITSTETKLMAHIYKQLIEDQTDLTVEVKEDLATSPVIIESMKAGDLQGSMQYTGTSLSSFFEIENPQDSEATLQQAKDAFAGDEFNFHWFDSHGFSNTYIFTVTRELAEEHNLEKVSDLKDIAGDLRAGFDTAWLEREEDGYPAFKEVYGIEFGDTKPMEISLVYDAVKNGEMDIVLAYSTDARIPEYDLVTLEDDLNFFPPYDASPVFLQETIDEYPEIADAIEPLLGLIDEEMMAILNGEVDIHGKSLEEAAEDFLVEQGLLE
ncbi:osmoprotectant transport system substrate-binding protein [Gracilibacillus halotolerans]|uniref:Osmoprotectant transport system substrate-binding protein n=1 Tax=Gracilibacillus halotolerans TaxID=74386 RepID=A0A841RL24_9BACI|nr:glycine betaine ABC transporter substrate-binding protein [Gracilibacillus halotolerans]MBB6512323.1 osmoprotectant transport system substrate-binding protein [Gracilibacillus halotolerans]